MILSCSNIGKLFGKKHILKQVSFHLKDHEKATVAGISGAGKPTLLKIIIGELTPDEGRMALGGGASIGYLAQHQGLDSESTIHDALLEVKRLILRMEERIRTLKLDMKSASDESLEAMLEEYNRLTRQFELEGGYACRSEITGVLKGLGFAEKEFPKPINALPDGQKIRVSLGKLLLTKPGVLLLDEPTNHLNMESVAWLETCLRTYSGNVIIVAHDRYFLNRVVAKIMELDNGTRAVFGGNYTAYSDKKAMPRDTRIQAYLNQQQEVRHQEAVIAELKSFNREESIRKAESRGKMLERIDRLEKPMDIDDSMDIRLESDVGSSKDVLTVIGLSESFGSQTLFTDANSEIKHGEQVAIIGDNGIGKTAFPKVINQLLPTGAGEVRPGSKMHIGYYDQEHQVFHMDKALFDEIQNTYPDMNNTQIRNTLVSFLSTGDDMLKLIRDLSSGERGRVSLAKPMFSGASFLSLDESTNHLDITSKGVLENALRHYTETIPYVSHNRCFINRTATRILDLTGQSLISYIGSYDHYLEKKDAMEAAFTARNKRTSFVPNLSQASGRSSQGSQSDLELKWKAQKGEQTRICRIQNELKKTEDSIRALETRDSEVGALFTRKEAYTDMPRPMELDKEKEEIAGQLEGLYQGWGELAGKA